MQTVDYFVATALKNLRRQRQLSLAQCAALTGVSKAMLGQIERNESGPTVATLWKIADGLQVPFSWFIQPPPSNSTTLPQGAEGGGITVRSLLPYDTDLAMDTLLITLAPGAVSHESCHAAGAIEQVIVVSGRLVLSLEETDYALASGEAKRFAADICHRYHNPLQVPVSFHSLIHYPLSTASGG
ncbi:helix-turn-helix domain-containing protein [Tatumella saanichensis]|uniref:helix-turn-helix domain-containing protein n=1 Tax=Tatumella saanichensis TaxID=480813 RepID=UPI0004A2DCAF|nr:XRE family transcriptional regulator [Tatumella saanichensis]